MKKITPKAMCAWIPKREDETHKGDYGRVLIVAGNKQFGGAAIMAAEACVKRCAGLTTVASDSVNRPALQTRIPECMFIDYENISSLSEQISQFDTILIGPGLGLDAYAEEIFRLVLEKSTEQQQVIIDGDGITIYAKGENPHPAAKLTFTPHAGEWERLKVLAPDAVTPTDVALAIDATIVLKGHRTKVYSGESAWQNMYGTPAMATGGMGDTLAGTICGLMAQTEKPITGTLAAVFLHSYIGEILAKKRYVVLPTEIAEELPTYLKIFSETDEHA
ncbi:NAD(P)H-hydrate dehydratase [Listeria monocytogenes]|nr:NAD(P)H-hydrate dehydratase [Listeria monocytogenes]EAC5985989.1 NAD(P)H-hydrate dehydratase [Listeria monocytogenes]